MLWQQLANGATMGMIYALITLGLTMVYGVLRILHISHAGIFALGGYIAVAASRVSPNLALVVTAAMLGCGIIGVLMQRWLYRPLLAESKVVSLIASIGMFTFMEDLFRLIAGPYVLPLPVRAPLGLDRFETAHVTGNQLIVLVASVALLIVAWFLINRTRLGLAWRATEQDFETASAFINARDFGFPTSISIISMAVFGGLGTLRGAVLGSLALGLAPEIFRPLVNYRNLMYGALLVLMMRFQPSGLIGDGSFIWESLQSVRLRLYKPKAVSGGEK